MGELILHIGMSKTGTTSLQRFSFRNRKRLETQGVALARKMLEGIKEPQPLSAAEERMLKL